VTVRSPAEQQPVAVNAGDRTEHGHQRNSRRSDGAATGWFWNWRRKARQRARAPPAAPRPPRPRPIRTVTVALVLLACWAVTSTSWSPTSRTTASTACPCRWLTTDPPTASVEQPAARRAPRPSPPWGSAKSGSSLLVGSWWARCSAGGGTAPALHAAVACPVPGRSPQPASAPAPTVQRPDARERARSRPRRCGGPPRPGGHDHGRTARQQSRPPAQPAPQPTPPHQPHRFRRSLVL
jgi:hypothetical protein